MIEDMIASLEGKKILPSEILERTGEVLSSDEDEDSRSVRNYDRSKQKIDTDSMMNTDVEDGYYGSK